MEFKEFPEAFAKSINEQIRDFTELKRNEIALREEEITEQYNSLGVIDDSIKSYYRLFTKSRFGTVLLWVTVLSVIIGVIYALELGFAENWMRIIPLSALLGAVIGSVGRMIIGDIIGTLFFFCLYPAFRFVCNKRAEARMNRRNCEIQQISEKLNLAAEKFKEKKLSILEEYRRGFEEEVARLSAVFAESENTRSVGDMIAEYLIEKLKNEPRPSSLEQINLRTDIRVIPDGVCYDDKIYDFVENRFKTLTAPHQQGALLMALCRYVAKKVNAEYKKDPSGTPYKLKCSYALYEQASAHIDYSSENGWYIPARAW